MRTIFGVVLAFAVGAGLLHFAQRAYLHAIAAQVAATPQPTFLNDSRPVMPTMSQSDAAELRRQLTQPLPPIDTRAAERAAIANAGHQADLARRRAEDAVPGPPH